MAISDASVMDQVRRQAGPNMGALASNTPPMTAPMSTPEPKSGAIMHAKVKIGQALDLIEMALPDLGSETPEGQAALAALRTLHKIVGQKRGEIDELQPAEAQNMLQNLPHAGGKPPGAGAMAAQPPVPGMGASSPPSPLAPSGASPPLGGAPSSLPGAM